MMQAPIVSVVMPVYNADLFLNEAVSSVLSQTFENFEFIIINDGSSDSSLDILSTFNDPRIILRTQSNRGLVKSLNLGISLSRGKYIARMDADDVCSTNRFGAQVEFMDSHLNCVVVGSNAKIIDMNGRFLYDSNVLLNWRDIKKILPESPFFHSSTMIRRDALISVGSYSETVAHFIEDRILWNKLALLGEFNNLSAPLLTYRLVPSSISNQKVSNKDINRICLKISAGEKLTDADFSYLNDLDKKQSTRNLMSAYYQRIGKIFLEQRFVRSAAIKNFLYSIYWKLWNFNSLFNLLLCALPKSVIFKWKSLRKL